MSNGLHLGSAAHIHQQRPYWPVRTAASRAGGQKVLETHCKVVHKGAGMPQQGLAAATGTQASADVMIAAAHAMAAWQTLQDPTSGAYYYFNTVTQQSSWTWPPAEQSAGAQQPQQLQDLGKVLGEQAAVWTAAMEGKAKPAAAPTDAGTIHTTQQAPGSAGDVEQWQQWRQQYQQWAQYAAMHANSGMTSAKDEKSESRSDAAQLALDPQIQAPPQPPAPAPQPEVANAEPPEANASASDSKQASATPTRQTSLQQPSADPAATTVVEPPPRPPRPPLPRGQEMPRDGERLDWGKEEHSNGEWRQGNLESHDGDERQRRWRDELEEERRREREQERWREEQRIEERHEEQHRGRGCECEGRDRRDTSHSPSRGRRRREKDPSRGAGIRCEAASEPGHRRNERRGTSRSPSRDEGRRERSRCDPSRGRGGGKRSLSPHHREVDDKRRGGEGWSDGLGAGRKDRSDERDERPGGSSGGDGPNVRPSLTGALASQRDAKATARRRVKTPVRVCSWPWADLPRTPPSPSGSDRVAEAVAQARCRFGDR